MIRKCGPAACLAFAAFACAEPPPPPHVDGAIVTRAVEIAQERANGPAAAPAAPGLRRAAETKPVRRSVLGLTLPNDA